MKKLYVVVRDDLDPGDQLAQAVHAATAFGRARHAELDAWVDGTNNLVVLSVGSIRELATLRDRLRDQIFVADIHEPDLGDELTAIAFDDRGRREVSSLPLALGWRSLERKLGERSDKIIRIA